jgi:glycerol-3-phosphate dehydrogenase
MRNRAELLGKLKASPGDETLVLIVGAGINGIGLYRDLALQGVPAILIDKGDFSSGTSAAPSRLIHGGLRYLETGEFALVRESVIERNHLVRNAPHLVKPIPVWVPAFNWFGGAFSAALRFLKLKKTPGAKGILVVKLGLVFFDWFGRATRNMPTHRILSRAASHRMIPGLADRVCAVAEYYDARLVHPERLALELVKDAEQDCPQSMALSYVSLQKSHGRSVTLRDEISGETISLTPRLVVNCAGAWADAVDRNLGIDKRLIGGTRGSHLVMRRPDIAQQLGDGMLYFETHDFRACLVYALDSELILLGTTDIRDEAPDDPACSKEEIDYLFKVLDEVLPGSNAKEHEIVFAYAGIRPLPWSGASATGAISRDHALHVFDADSTRPYPVMTLVGGKWTTYRACAEQIAEAVMKHLGKAHANSTLSQPIGGSKGLPGDQPGLESLRAEISKESGIAESGIAPLLRRYGTAARDVAKTISSAGTQPLGDGKYRSGEIRWIIRNERVTRLADIILRRTLLPFEDGISAGVVDAIVAIAAEELGWTDERRRAEIEHTSVMLGGRYRVRALTPTSSAPPERN